MIDQGDCSGFNLEGTIAIFAGVGEFHSFIPLLPVKGKVCIQAKVANQAGAYPGFCNMKQLGIFLLPPGLDASPSQDYPHLVPIYTPGWREAL